MVSFETLCVSTRTIIASTQVEFNIEEIFQHIDVEENERSHDVLFPGYTFRCVAIYYKHAWKQSQKWNPKYHRRGNVVKASKDGVRNKNQDFVSTSTSTSTSTSSSTSPPTLLKKSFRNALNIIYEISHTEWDPRHVNFKISKNGKFQLTGCKEMMFAKICVVDCMERIFTMVPHAILSPTLNTIQKEGLPISFQTVMTNVDFHVGYTVNRQQLDHLINHKTPYYSLLETSFGYTGVNIKFPLENEWWKVPCPILHWFPLSSVVPVKQLNQKEDTIPDFNPILLPFQEYTKPLYEIISKDVLSRYQRKGRYNTFLVFHSGKVIMSGMFLETMKCHFGQFFTFMKEWQPLLEEVVSKTKTTL